MYLFTFYKHLTLVDAHDEKWKAIRKSLSPTFTTGKLKGMMEHMGKVADNMVQCLEKKTKEVFVFECCTQPTQQEFRPAI